MTNLITNLQQSARERFFKTFGTFEELKKNVDRDTIPTRESLEIREALLELYENMVAFQDQIVQETVVNTVDEIDSFDLVEPCNPDCTPEEHAFHEGTWKAHLTLENILKGLLTPSTKEEK